MDDELVKEKCKMAFKVGLNHSGMSIQELSDKSGVPVGTLQQYSSGRIDLRNATALSVIHVATALGMDPRILVGIMPIDEFYNRKQKLKEAKALKEKLAKQNA